MLRRSIPCGSCHTTGAVHRDIAVTGVVEMSHLAAKYEHSQPEGKPENPDRSPWVLLLILPVVVPLLTGLYNSVDPELFGMPLFYWLQLAFVPLSALCTAVVYLKTRKR
jgi:hypothetical protein